MAETVALPPLPPPSVPAMKPLDAGSPDAGLLDAGSLGRLLGALAAREGPVPKYRYPSAGTLYPVQAYVVLRAAIPGLEAGTYYHDPEAHALVRLSGDMPAAPDGTCPPALIFLCAQAVAIAPIYGELTHDFSMLEAGYMHGALCEAGTGIGLRDAGDPAGNEPLRLACHLMDTHVPLACWAVGEDI